LPDGSEDLGFNIAGTGFNGNITQLAHQSNNKLIVTGFFSLYDNQQAGRVARMFTSASTDRTENIFIQDDVAVFPNPGTDEFYFRIHNARPGEIHLKVRDIHGWQIYEGKYNTNEISITTAGWLPGIYLVEMLNTQGNKFVLRLMKQ